MKKKKIDVDPKFNISISEEVLEVEGNTLSLCMGVAVLIDNLLKIGIPANLLEDAFKMGFKINKEEESENETE